jgi:hypothetical protein
MRELPLKIGTIAVPGAAAEVVVSTADIAGRAAARQGQVLRCRERPEVRRQNRLLNIDIAPRLPMPRPDDHENFDRKPFANGKSSASKC